MCEADYDVNRAVLNSQLELMRERGLHDSPAYSDLTVALHRNEEARLKYRYETALKDHNEAKILAVSITEDAAAYGFSPERIAKQSDEAWIEVERLSEVAERYFANLRSYQRQYQGYL